MNIATGTHEKILIIHTHGGMGDLLLSSVIAEALHNCYPGCHITLWTQSRFAALLDHHPFVDACLDLDPAAPLLVNVRRLKSHQFDTVLIPWSVSRHAWVTALAGIPTRVGQGGRFAYSFLFTHPVRVRSVYGDTTSHWSDIQLDYSREIGCQPSSSLHPVVITTQQEKESAVALFKSIGVTGDNPVCGLHICKGLPVDERCWPLDRFIDIAATLMCSGFDVVLTGISAEKPLTEKVAAQARTKYLSMPLRTTQSVIVDLAGVCTLRETAAAIERMAVFICPDTGTGHLASALNVPVIAIFPLRSDIPARWRPSGNTCRIIRPTGYECAGPCVKEICVRFTCLLHIDPEEVVAAALELVKQARTDKVPELN